MLGSQDHDPIESAHDLISLFEYLFGKSVPGFPGHDRVSPPFTLTTGKRQERLSNYG
jgi:hypothetical protein